MRILAKLKHISILLIIALLAAGCGKPSTKQNATLVIWLPFAAEEALRPITQAFEQANKGVRVTIIDKEIERYEPDLLDALAAGKGPDIFAINNSWLPDYTDKITPAPKTLWQFVDFKRDFVDVIADDFTRNDTIFGTALSVDTLGLYYNKALLADAGVYTPPATWAELQTAVRKLTRQNQDGYFTRSGIALGHSSISSGGKINRAEDILYLMILQLGGQGFKPDASQPIFGNSVQRNGKSSIPTVDALRFYSSFANAENTNYTWNALSDYSIDAFANDRAAMMINYSYARDIIKQKNTALSFDTAPVPQTDMDKPAVNFANYWGQVVSKQSKFSDLAWKFLQFATQKDQLDKYLSQSKAPSSRRDLLEVQQNDPNLTAFAHAAASSKSFFRPHAAEVDKIFAAAIDAVVFKGQEPQISVAQAVRQAQAIAQRRN